MCGKDCQNKEEFQEKEEDGPSFGDVNSIFGGIFLGILVGLAWIVMVYVAFSILVP